MANSPYIRKGRKYLPEEVLPYITKKKSEKDYDGDKILMNSLRYHTFNKGLKCKCCGIEGKYFVKERFNDPKVSQTRYHFNLYALDKNGNEVLMTKDHIVPKSKGGTDKLINLQTMCVYCNEHKKSKLINHVKNKSTLVVGDILHD